MEKRIGFGSCSTTCRGNYILTPHIHEQNDCIYNGYDNINLEPNAMNNIDTCRAHEHAPTLSTEHTERCSLMHIVSHRTCGSSPPCTRHPIHALCTCVLRCGLFLFTRLLFLFVPLLFFPALPDVFLRVPREVEVQTPVWLPLGDRGHFRPRDTPHRLWAPTGILTSWIPKSSTSRLPATSTGSTPSTTNASLNDPNVDDNQLAKYLAVVVESTGKPVEMRSSKDQFCWWHSKLERCSESVSCCFSTRNDLSNWVVCPS